MQTHINDGTDFTLGGIHYWQIIDENENLRFSGFGQALANCDMSFPDFEFLKSGLQVGNLWVCPVLSTKLETSSCGDLLEFCNSWNQNPATPISISLSITSFLKV